MQKEKRKQREHRRQKKKKVSEQGLGAGLPMLRPPPAPRPTQGDGPLHSSLEMEPDFHGAGLNLTSRLTEAGLQSPGQPGGHCPVRKRVCRCRPGRMGWQKDLEEKLLGSARTCFSR